jgi:phosphate transport system protein
MGAEANELVRLAVDAVLNGDVELASRVILSDEEINHLERETLHKTVVAVMQEAPVAADLRFLISTVGVVGEIEKVGDHAVKLARRATKLSGHFPAEMRLALQELSELARTSFAASLRLYLEYSEGLALEIVHGDHAVDTAYVAARNRIFDLIRAKPDATPNLVRTIECFHALEHVADNAVAIAERISMISGKG